MKGLIWIIQMRLYQYLRKFGLNLIQPKNKVAKIRLVPYLGLILYPKMNKKVRYISSKLSITCEKKVPIHWLLIPVKALNLSG